MKSNNQDLAIVSKLEDFFPEGLTKPKVLSNYQASSWDINLEIINLPRGELPQENILSNYTIGINLGQSHHIEQTIECGFEF